MSFRNITDYPCREEKVSRADNILMKYPTESQAKTSRGRRIDRLQLGSVEKFIARSKYYRDTRQIYICNNKADARIALCTIGRINIPGSSSGLLSSLRRSHSSCIPSIFFFFFVFSFSQRSHTDRDLVVRGWFRLAGKLDYVIFLVDFKIRDFDTRPAPFDLWPLRNR